jgi:hypothetical protein
MNAACVTRYAPLSHPETIIYGNILLLSSCSIQGTGIYTVTCMSDSRRGFGLDIEFIDNFNTHLVITLNCSVISNFHILQFTVTHAKIFPSAVSSLVAA